MDHSRDDGSNFPTNDPDIQVIVRLLNAAPIREHLDEARAILVGKLPESVSLEATAAGQLLLALEALVDYVEKASNPPIVTVPEPKYRSRK